MPMRKVRKTLRPRKYNKRKPIRYKKVIKRRYKPSIAKAPFPMRKNCTFLYKQPSTTITSAGINAFYAIRFRCNSLFDFDYDDLIANKQPLFYDQLLSDTGPYRTYKVNAWKTTYKIVNLETSRTLMVYFDPGSLAGPNDADTSLEVRNRPYVQSRILTPIGSGGAQTTIKSFRKVKQFIPPTAADSTFTASYSSSPSSLVYASLNIVPADSSVTAYSFMIEVSHVFYCTFYNQDAVVS